MRVAVDAMGGDHGPSVVVPGAVDGARAFDVGLRLVGDPALVGAALEGLDVGGLDIEVVPATDVIGMDEHPAQAVRRKPHSSIVVALRMIKEGNVEAMVSAGNSGAVMAGALMVLGRIPGIERPAIASYMPSGKSRTLVLDLGAVTDPKPENIVQFAVMGKVYAERVMDRVDPSVGLLSNGEEPTKGNLFVQAVYPLLAATPGIRFHGNVEGKDVALGTVDIVVTDGFTGNVALKTAEGVATMLTDVLRDELTATLPRKLAAFMLRPAFRAVRARLDYAEIGGAPLLGVNGTTIIAHGRSNQLAIRNAVGVARRSAEQGLIDGIKSALDEAHAAITAPSPVDARS
ncbi:MAG: phosphate acyltransferase PlsX [Chloroflexia bacterium]|nr:phosphate acyltransferase PlsX [Chloroflexia bacterium]